MAHIIKKDVKRLRAIERAMKGVANHRRVEIMEYMHRHPELSVMEISKNLDVDFKTISAHIKKLADAGFVMKRNQGPAVRHRLTRNGEKIINFLHEFFK